MKKVIAVDFDDVIAMFNQAYVQHHNQTYKEPYITYELINTFDMAQLYGIDGQTVVSRVRNFCHEHHDTILPWEHIHSTLAEMAARTDIHIVTSRCESLNEITSSWLAEHSLLEFFSDLHYTNGFGTKFPERIRTKLQVCQEIGASVLLEDAPANAEAVATGGIPVLMPKLPWNANFSYEKVTHYDSWLDVEQLIFG